MTSSISTSYKVCDSTDQHAVQKVAIKYEVRAGSREEQREGGWRGKEETYMNFKLK